jgi:inosose dehydratase
MSGLRKFKLGVGAIAWTNPGIKSFADNYTGEEILSQMSEIGFEGTEMNRKFPSDLPMLKALLKRYRLEISSQFKFVLFSDRAHAERETETFRKHADFLRGLNCKHVIVCEAGGSPLWDPRRPDSGVAIPLDDAAWRALTDHLHAAGAYCRKLGMRLVYHHHAATAIETPAEIDELMRRTDPDLVGLLLDTGHARYGGYEPIDLLRKHRGRIGYVHLKDVRKEVLARVKSEGLDFRQAVMQGVFTVPGDGCIDFAPIIGHLIETGFDSWALIEAEQDPAVADPYRYQKMGKEHIEFLIGRLSATDGQKSEIRQKA